MTGRSLPPLSEIYRENMVLPEDLRQQPVPNREPPSAPIIAPTSTKSAGYSMKVLAGAAVVGILLLVGCIMAFSMFGGSSSEQNDAVEPEDAPAPQITVEAPSVTEEAPPPPAKPVNIRYKVTGTIGDPGAKPPKVTITFYNSKGRVQDLTQSPAPGSGSFVWDMKVTNRTHSEHKGGLKVSTNVPTKLTCTVIENGQETYTRTAENAVNCGFKD